MQKNLKFPSLCVQFMVFFAFCTVFCCKVFFAFYAVLSQNRFLRFTRYCVEKNSDRGEKWQIWGMHLGPLVNTWVHLGPLVSTWLHLGRPGSTLVPLGPSGSPSVHMGPPGSTWVHMGPLGFTLQQQRLIMIRNLKLSTTHPLHNGASP